MSLFPEEYSVSMANKFVNMVSNGKEFEMTLAKYLKSEYPNNAVREQVKVGKYIGGKKNYVVDILFNHDILISAKYQETPGTSEQKIMLEMANLQKLCDKEGFKEAYLVYYGSGFTLIETYQSEEMRKYLNRPNVKLISFEDFKRIKIV